MQLVEEATEGCWIGHRARMFTSEIGSVYSPPKADRSSSLSDPRPRHVETVIDIGHSKSVSSAPWLLCLPFTILSCRVGPSCARKVASVGS